MIIVTRYTTPENNIDLHMLLLTQTHSSNSSCSSCYLPVDVISKRSVQPNRRNGSELFVYVHGQFDSLREKRVKHQHENENAVARDFAS
jgi:hypothetical protein